MKKQIIIVGGGTTFDSYEDYINYLENKEVGIDTFTPSKDWKDNIGEELGEKYEVLTLRMPNKTNAKYNEWRIWFDRTLPLLKNEVILVGHSLGGMFLAKYLSKTTFPKKILATILVAAPFDGEERKESLSEFKPPKFLARFAKQGGKIFIIHSKDDPAVEFSQSNKYKKILPEAKILPFKNRGHFNAESFPEIVELIKRF